VQALEDSDFGVRWLAAEGLVKMGDAALAPLFMALEKRADSTWQREGAHHVLRIMADRGASDWVAPVMAALEGVEPVLEVPLKARDALGAM
jgi:HEAT repeat protein